MYVDSLRVHDFRAISASTVTFTHPASGGRNREYPNINLLVGTNGGGKSTILKAIAAAALNRFMDLEAVTGGSIQGWPRIGSDGACTASVTLLQPADDEHASEMFREELHIARGSAAPDERLRHVRATLGKPPILFGYGPRRASGGQLSPLALDDPVAARVASLFDDVIALVPPEQWLLDAIGGQDDLLAVVNSLMPPDTELTDRVEDEVLMVRDRGLEVPRTLLSDGAQSYLAWALDLCYWLYRLAAHGDIRSVRATVLVDEIDQRMHPRWQQRLLQQLADGLPRLQFICSAHSPLVAGGLRQENLSLLEPDLDAPGEGAMQAVRLEEDLYGRTADGVLTSSYFNLPSTRADRFRQDLRALAEAGQDLDDAAVEFIRALAAGASGQQQRVRSPILERPERFRRRRT